MITERVDNIPLLLHELQKSSLIELLNEHFPDHGNWQGLSGGAVTTTFLSHTLSRNDHRLSHLEDWASKRLHTLRYCLNEPALKASDFSDDRLGALADKYADDEAWYRFEQAHNQKLLQVYDLNPSNEAIRLDPMIVQSHRAVGGDFQMGYAKQHRADLPQMKAMIATLDPLALPLCSVVVPGNTADDVLYIPAIEQMTDYLPTSGQLLVGDSKMDARATREHIHNKAHYYLMPLSLKQCPVEQIQTYLSEQSAAEELLIWREEDKNGKSITKAKAFEQQAVIESSDGTYCWKERRIVVYSPAHAKRQRTGFEDRMAKAQAALDEVFTRKKGKKRHRNFAQAKQAVHKILAKHRLNDFIHIHIQTHQNTKTTRGYSDKPKRVSTEMSFSLEYKLNQTAIDQYTGRMGWRVYATNAPQQQFDTLKVVQCYRSQYKIEHKFDELLHRTTALMPLFLHKQHRIKALIRLLLLALKTATLIQHKVRERLKDTGEQLNQLYPGNPARATDRPTTNLLINAFEYIDLVILKVENKMVAQITSLKTIQLKILDLLEIPPEKYTDINKFFFSHYDLHEM